MSSVNNNIPFVPENTIDPAAGLNESINVIDALLQVRVLAVKQNTPAASPSAGDRYIVGTSPTGAWAGQTLKLATWMPDGYWMFRTAWVAVHGTTMVINTGADWVPATPGSVVWGGIAGDIADQSDLQSALHAKVDKVAGKGLSTEDYTSGEKSKLAGIATNATANSTDAELRDRSTHTGTQAASTISDLTEVTQDMVGTMIVAGTNVSVSYDDGAGTLTISATGGGSGMANPMTTAGDIITGGAAGAAQRLAAGVNGQRLTMVSGTPAWAYDLGATITESTTSRNAALTDVGNYLRHTNASASTLTIPPQSSVAWPGDAEIHVRRAAAGNLTLTPGSGVTLNAPSGGTLVMTNAMTVTLKRVAADVWDVIGQTVAA